MTDQGEALDTLRERLRYWRRIVMGLTQRELCEWLNQDKPKEERVPKTTLSNYERGTEPPASFIEALKRAFPDLNLNWLLLNEGEPSQLQEIARRAHEELEQELAGGVQKVGGFGALGTYLQQMSLPPYIQRLPLGIRDQFYSTVANLRTAQFHGLQRALPTQPSETQFGQLEQKLGHLLLSPFDLLPVDPPPYGVDSPPLRNASFERYVEAMFLAVNLATAVEPDLGAAEEG